MPTCWVLCTSDFCISRGDSGGKKRFIGEHLNDNGDGACALWGTTETSRTVQFETEKAGKDYHQGLLRRDKVNAKC